MRPSKASGSSAADRQSPTLLSLPLTLTHMCRRSSPSSREGCSASCDASTRAPLTAPTSGWAGASGGRPATLAPSASSAACSTCRRPAPSTTSWLSATAGRPWCCRHAGQRGGGGGSGGGPDKYVQPCDPMSIVCMSACGAQGLKDPLNNAPARAQELEQHCSNVQVRAVHCLLVAWLGVRVGGVEASAEKTAPTCGWRRWCPWTPGIVHTMKIRCCSTATCCTSLSGRCCPRRRLHRLLCLRLFLFSSTIEFKRCKAGFNLGRTRWRPRRLHESISRTGLFVRSVSEGEVGVRGECSAVRGGGACFGQSGNRYDSADDKRVENCKDCSCENCSTLEG